VLFSPMARGALRPGIAVDRITNLGAVRSRVAGK
jgi:hypothetical protein